jgi:uncharacterized repeat protein (TIGR02543 family)
VTALFRYRFWVANDFANTTITGHFDVDNEAYAYLNGTDGAHQLFGLPGGTDTFVPEMDIQPLMTAGWNTLYVNLQDFGGLSGINYNITIATDSANPITLAAPGSQVTFDAQGGTVDPAQKTVAPGALLSTITIPTPTRPGYNFVGWFTAASGGEEVTDAYTQFKPTSDLTFFARWTPVPVVLDDQAVTQRTLSTTGSTLPPFMLIGLMLVAGSAVILRLGKRKL